MVAWMLNSIQTTLTGEEHGPAAVASCMLTLALQDVTLVVSFIIVGWLLSSLVLRFFGIGADAVVRKHKFVSEVTESTVEQNVDAHSEDPEWAHAGLALLEHYGVFGSAPGAWTAAPVSSRTRRTCEELESLVADTEANDADATAAVREDAPTLLEALNSAQPLMPRRVLGTRTPRGMSLLDQYGVFGVSPKCWMNDKIEGFGEILTAIT